MTSTRDSEICALRADGLTLAEIAARFSLTRERVRQILVKQHGPSAEKARAVRAAAREKDATAISLRVAADVRAHPGSSLGEVANRLGLSVDVVTAALPQQVRRLVVRDPTRKTRTWSDDDMLESLRRAATYAHPLTVAEYRRLVGCGEVAGAGALSIEKRFGSWLAACEAAGVEPGRRLRPDYQSTWTDDDIVAYVAAYLSDRRYPGTYDGYDRWRKSECPEAPSGPTMRNRLGAWSVVKRRVLADDTLRRDVLEATG